MSTHYLRVPVTEERRPLVLRRWVLACVAGGLVGGLGLGALQARALRPWLDERSRRAWSAVTVLAAGLGWGVAAASSARDSGASTETALWVVLLGAAGLGLAMGLFLGVAQALVLRRELPRPWRWTWVSALAWTLTMPVIFLGATRPDESWTLSAVLLTVVLTGALAGTTYGVTTALLLPGLEGGRPVNQLVLHLLVSPLRHLLPHHVVGLAVTGRRTGTVHRFPVHASGNPERLVVLPGHPERKTWWRNLDTEHEIQLLRDGVWSPARARVVRPEDHSWLADRYVYAVEMPNVSVPRDAPLVEVDLRDTHRV